LVVAQQDRRFDPRRLSCRPDRADARGSSHEDRRSGEREGIVRCPAKRSRHTARNRSGRASGMSEKSVSCRVRCALGHLPPEHFTEGQLTLENASCSALARSSGGAEQARLNPSCRLFGGSSLAVADL
jgi:hypothetical protein